MTWNNANPDIGNSIAEDIADIKENFQHSHDASGSVDTLASTCKINSNGILEGDTTSGRVLRQSILIIEDGTNADTLKCTLENVWNGDTIAETDNITKDATTGNFTLDADGNALRIEAAGLSGNVVAAWGHIYRNTWGGTWVTLVYANANDILVSMRPGDGTSEAAVDMTGGDGVDNAAGGLVRLQIQYITAA